MTIVTYLSHGEIVNNQIEKGLLLRDITVSMGVSLFMEHGVCCGQVCVSPSHAGIVLKLLNESSWFSAEKLHRLILHAHSLLKNFGISKYKPKLSFGV